MSAVCPSCGVPVTPGYVKCPKCHTPLPYGAGKRSTASAGGTAVQDRGFPIVAIVVPVLIVLAIVLFFGVLQGDGDADDNAAEVVGQPPPNEPAVPQVAQQRPSATVQPTVVETPNAPPRSTPAIAGADLERALRKQRLWSTVEIAGDRIDVRSSSCSEAAMTATIDAAVASLREVGLTQLRCLAQSGAVVFARNL